MQCGLIRQWAGEEAYRRSLRRVMVISSNEALHCSPKWPLSRILIGHWLGWIGDWVALL